MVRVLVVSANRERYPDPVVPLDALYVAGAVRGRNEVVFADLCFEDDPLAAVAARVRDRRPDAVGLALRNLHDNS